MEQIIHPIAAPANAPKYYYPGVYYYTPEPYQTTHIPKHHHHVVPSPVKHAMHEFAHPFGDGYPIASPHCDIRETKSAYYLDVELPGLKDKKDVKLRWTGLRSLFVDARITREKLSVEEEEDKKEKKEKETGQEAATGAAAAAAAESGGGGGGVVTAANPPDSSSSSSSSSSSESEKKARKKKSKKSKKASKKAKKQEKQVHFLKKERKTGELARAFNFPVDVEQDKTVAKLAYGVLSVMVPKKVKHVEEEEEGHKDVDIEHAGH